MLSLIKGIFFFSIILINISNAIAHNFSGTWCWNKNNQRNDFSITIRKVLNMYKGSYSCVAYGGDKIDDSEDAFNFKISNKSSIKTKLKGGSGDGFGLIKLSLLNEKTIEWQVLKNPDLDFYPPAKAILYKCD